VCGFFLCESQNKQRLFPYTALNELLFVTYILCVYLAVRNIACLQCGVCVFKTMGKVLLLTSDVKQVATLQEIPWCT